MVTDHMIHLNLNTILDDENGMHTSCNRKSNVSSDTVMENHKVNVAGK